VGLLTDLGVAALIDEACGPRPSGLALSPGTYLALTVLTRVVDPCSKRGFADWWRTTAADRFTKIATSTLDHRRFWDALHAVPLDGLAQIETKLALGFCARYGLDTSSVALDMTNFATFIETPATARPLHVPNNSYNTLLPPVRAHGKAPNLSSVGTVYAIVQCHSQFGSAVVTAQR